MAAFIRTFFRMEDQSLAIIEMEREAERFDIDRCDGTGDQAMEEERRADVSRAILAIGFSVFRHMFDIMFDVDSAALPEMELD